MPRRSPDESEGIYKRSSVQGKPVYGSGASDSGRLSLVKTYQRVVGALLEVLCCISSSGGEAAKNSRMPRSRWVDQVRIAAAAAVRPENQCSLES